MNPQDSWLAAMLLLCPLAAQEREAEPVSWNTRLEQLEKERGDIYAKWRKDIQEQKKAGAKAIRMRPDYSELRTKYIAGADQYGEKAVQFLLPALNFSSSPAQYREIVDRLVGHHLDSPDLWMLGSFLGYLDRMVDENYKEEVIGKIEAHGKNKGLLGWVAFDRHQNTLRSESPKSEAFLAAKALVSKAIDGTPDPRLKSQFQQLITEQEKFGLGMVAPDIDGIDLDGVAFKLSDYKGKVVFLDFWGDW